ncbi:MAG: hypothetical protein WBX25_25855 [Rhodomicrobium sp.]
MRLTQRLLNSWSRRSPGKEEGPRLGLPGDWTAIRLSPTEAIPAPAAGASQAHSYELVRHLDGYTIGLGEFLDRDVDIPPAGIAAEPEPLVLLRSGFQGAEAPRITIVIGHASF